MHYLILRLDNHLPSTPPPPVQISESSFATNSKSASIPVLVLPFVCPRQHFEHVACCPRALKIHLANGSWWLISEPKDHYLPCVQDPGHFNQPIRFRIRKFISNGLVLLSPPPLPSPLCPSPPLLSLFTPKGHGTEGCLEGVSTPEPQPRDPR